MSLLGLVMIVKNEERGIVQTLESVRPWIDSWTILDTGSTDRTKELIRETLKGVPGKLHEDEFKDFAKTRNYAFVLHGNQTDFGLMLSGDDTLVNGAALREFCKTNKNTAAGAYFLQMEYGGCVYDFGCLKRCASEWKYAGAVHEVLISPEGAGPTIRVPNCKITHAYYPGDNFERWKRDKTLLFKDLAKEPNNPRTVFYLAQTHECLGELQPALDLYEVRASMEGWIEEHYEALFRCGRVARALEKPWIQVKDYFLQAFARDPRRAEPLCEIASQYWHEENHALAYVYAWAGAQIPASKEVSLFVDPLVQFKCLDIVGRSAYYIGRFAEGQTAVQKAIELCPNDEAQMGYLLNNLKFYVDKEAA